MALAPDKWSLYSCRRRCGGHGFIIWSSQDVAIETFSCIVGLKIASVSARYIVLLLWPKINIIQICTNEWFAVLHCESLDHFWRNIRTWSLVHFSLQNCDVLAVFFSSVSDSSSVSAVSPLLDGPVVEVVIVLARTSACRHIVPVVDPIVVPRLYTSVSVSISCSPNNFGGVETVIPGFKTVNVISILLRIPPSDTHSQWVPIVRNCFRIRVDKVESIQIFHLELAYKEPSRGPVGVHFQLCVIRVN